MRIKTHKREITDTSCPIRLFDVAEFSVHDGPGVRVVVYFQGCNAKCDWCHSPQSQFAIAPLLFNPNVCSGCQRCSVACPRQVHRFLNGKHLIERSACTQCGACIVSCPCSIAGVKGSALHLPTVDLTVSSLLIQIESYIRLTGENGGITLSGGEALLQLEAALEILQYCKQQGYHTAVETSGLLSPAVYERVMPFVDLWLFGMRVVTGRNAASHESHIRQVLDVLVQNKAEILPRIPMVPSFFDEDDILQRIERLMNDYSLTTVCLNQWNKDYALYYAQSGIPLQMFPPSSSEIENCETKIIDFFTHSKFKQYENSRIKS